MSPHIYRRSILGIAVSFAAGAAHAQAPWPDRPVRLINSGAPGSGIDLMARILSDALAQRLGQPFPVENRPGAGSLLAAQAHAQAGADVVQIYTGLIYRGPALVREAALALRNHAARG